MNLCEITLAVTAISNALASLLNDDELSLAGALFTQLGDTLTTLSVYRSICCNNNENIEKENYTS